MQPSRKKPKEGDVFVIQPKKDLYFYGKVIRTNIPSKDPFINGWNLIYIYKTPSKEMIMPTLLDPRQLLTPPQIVNNQGWLKGYFQTVGFSMVTKDDIVKDYGFWDIVTKQFIDEEGKPLAFKPTICVDYGLGSYGSVSYDVKKALESNPELTIVH